MAALVFREGMQRLAGRQETVLRVIGIELPGVVSSVAVFIRRDGLMETVATGQIFTGRRLVLTGSETVGLPLQRHQTELT